MNMDDVWKRSGLRCIHESCAHCKVEFLEPEWWIDQVHSFYYIAAEPFWKEGHCTPEEAMEKNFKSYNFMHYFHATPKTNLKNMKYKQLYFMTNNFFFPQNIFSPIRRYKQFQVWEIAN